MKEAAFWLFVAFVICIWRPEAVGSAAGQIQKAYTAVVKSS